MFEVPSAKRVKRSELFDLENEDQNAVVTQGNVKNEPLKDESDGHNDDEDILPDYGFEYDFVSPNVNSTSDSRTQQAAISEETKPIEKDPEIYQFNLFAPAKPSKSITSQPRPPPPTTNDQQPNSQPLQISIRSPSPVPEAISQGTLRSLRPDTHYFTSAFPPATLESLRTTYLAAAITPSTIQQLSKFPWPGTYQPWRVINLPAHSKQIILHKPSHGTIPYTAKPPLHSETRSRRRARPSKKRRDLAKAKAQKRQISIDETKTKEEHEREKRNRKNRERKIKRRAKERREKEGAKGGEVDGGGGDGAMRASVSVDTSDN